MLTFESVVSAWVCAGQPNKIMKNSLQHFGKFKKHGEWSVPVFPNNLSLVGSVQTPYIWDTHLDFRDLADAIEKVYKMKPEERISNGLKGREWVTSKESMMSANNMCNNMIEGINETLENFTPKPSFDITKITELEDKCQKQKLIY